MNDTTDITRPAWLRVIDGGRMVEIPVSKRTAVAIVGLAKGSVLDIDQLQRSMKVYLERRIAAKPAEDTLYAALAECSQAFRDYRQMLIAEGPKLKALLHDAVL